MIGPSVHGVRPQVGKGSRRAVGALVPVGYFSDADNEPTPVQKLGVIR